MSVNEYRVTISENRYLHRVPDLLIRLCTNFQSNPMLSLYRPLKRPDPTGYDTVYHIQFVALITFRKRFNKLITALTAAVLLELKPLRVEGHMNIKFRQKRG